MTTEIPIKVWAQAEAQRRGCAYAAIWTYIKRGQYPNLRRRWVNKRVVYVQLEMKPMEMKTAEEWADYPMPPRTITVDLVRAIQADALRSSAAQIRRNTATSDKNLRVWGCNQAKLIEAKANQLDPAPNSR